MPEFIWCVLWFTAGLIGVWFALSINKNESGGEITLATFTGLIVLFFSGIIGFVIMGVSWITSVGEKIVIVKGKWDKNNE